MAQRKTALDVRMATAIAGGVDNVAAFCREQNISRQTFYKWRRRFAAEGLDGLREKSRRPHTMANRASHEIEDLVIATRTRLIAEGRDHGPQSIVWTLATDGSVCPSRSTVWRILRRHGLIVDQPRKRPKSATKRFTYSQPNGCWQSDWTHWHLADGRPVAIAGTIDDHSRYLCGLAAAAGDGTAELVWAVMLAAISECGVPAMSLTDNGLAYTGKRRGFEAAFERNLRTLGTHTINSTPNHPQTCGKIERSWQTLKRWLAAQPAPETVDDLNTLLADFRDSYNHHRRHRALRGDYPATVFTATSKARPAEHPLDEPVFVTRQTVNPRQGKISVGRYFVQVGNQWGGHTLDSICEGTHIVIFSGTTIVRDFTADPTKRYQGQPRAPGTYGKRHPLPTP